MAAVEVMNEVSANLPLPQCHARLSKGDPVRKRKPNLELDKAQKVQQFARTERIYSPLHPDPSGGKLAVMPLIWIIPGVEAAGNGRRYS